MPRLDFSRILKFLGPEPGPQRVYGISLFINTFGYGLILTSMTLYFTRVVHLSATQVGSGLTIAGLVGLLTAIPVGDLADRRGPREMVRAALLLQCIAVFCYVFIHTFAAFLVVASVESLAFSASVAAEGALVRRLGGENPTGFRSSERAISNLGLSLGALACGVAIQIDTPTAYRTLLIVNGLTFLVALAILGRLPRYPPLPQPEAGPRWGALTDKPFVAYTVLNGAMRIQYFVIMLSLPLWVVDHTHAPRWSVSLFLLINTVLVVLFQIRVGRNVKTVRQGGTALRRAGVIFLFSCAGVGLATGLPAWAALLLIVVAVTLHTYGELWFAAGSFAFEFGLPPAHAQGQYQGLAGIGAGVGGAAAPILLIGVCLTLGRAGWIGLGVCFALLGLTAPALARWGERTRPLSAEASDTEPSDTEPAAASD